LKSGGSISIDPTEALVSIDVNTARFTRARDPEESALLTNVEAAREVARQLRLRDLGGLIVIDFIDMRNPKNRQQVEKELKNAFKGDKANVEFSKISKFGLLEMCREHLRSPLIDTSHVECPYCSGTGKYRSKEALSLAIIRELHAKASLGAIAEIKISLCPEAAQHLLNTMRSELYRLEQHYGLIITVTGHATMPVDHYSIDYTEKKQQ
jgi:ribonuclease E